MIPVQVEVKFAVEGKLKGGFGDRDNVGVRIRAAYDKFGKIVCLQYTQMASLLFQLQLQLEVIKYNNNEASLIVNT